jgi:hypothetical protein
MTERMQMKTIAETNRRRGKSKTIGGNGIKNHGNHT